MKQLDFKEVISAIIYTFDGLFLMQLRDFSSTISSPGKWGLFSGELREGELPLSAVMRELWEELRFKPLVLSPFKELNLKKESLLIHTYYCRLDIPVRQLILCEGQELGIFSAQEILKGELFSKKWQCTFPVTTHTSTIFSSFYKSNWKNTLRSLG